MYHFVLCPFRHIVRSQAFVVEQAIIRSACLGAMTRHSEESLSHCQSMMKKKSSWRDVRKLTKLRSWCGDWLLAPRKKLFTSTVIIPLTELRSRVPGFPIKKEYTKEWKWTLTNSEICAASKILLLSQIVLKQAVTFLHRRVRPEKAKKYVTIASRIDI